MCWALPMFRAMQSSGCCHKSRMMTRDERQRRVWQWVRQAFGDAHCSLEQRAVRFLEEALELYQAAGGSPTMAHSLITHVFSNPPGNIAQEIGGCGTTLLSVAEAAHVSADREEKRELQRVLSKPLAHFRERNERKNAAGFDVTGGERG